MTLDGARSGAIGSHDDIAPEKQADEFLRDTLAFNQLILNTASIGILTYKASGACVSANPAAAALTGGTIEELLAQNFRRIDSWKSSGLLQAAQEALASGAEVRRDAHVVTTFGMDVWYHARFLSFHARGEPHLLLMISDVTGRKRAEEALRESEGKFRTLTEAVEVGIFHSLLDGTFLHVNPAIARMAGYESVEEFMGLKASDLYANPSDRQEVIAELLASGRVKERELLSVWKDGLHHWISFSAVLMRNRSGDPVSVLGTIIDITRRKEAAEERIQLLEREHAARLEAESALRDRDEFLTIGAHELKTPLAALKIQVEGMQRRLERADTPAGDLGKGLDIAARQVQRLVRLVTGLLDITRIRTGRLEIYRRACDLATLTREVLARNHAALHRAGCAASYSGPESIPGIWDADRLEQVLENLLGNAMKFARGTRIDVRCDHSPEIVRISIRDRGTGIPSTDLDRIFEPYERGGGKLHLGGLGMGLYISREIIREHGGSIRAENAEDGGSLFIVDLPHGVGGSTPPET
jgi:PAS domain S-box-containing protein